MSEANIKITPYISTYEAAVSMARFGVAIHSPLPDGRYIWGTSRRTHRRALEILHEAEARRDAYKRKCNGGES